MVLLERLERVREIGEEVVRLQKESTELREAILCDCQTTGLVAEKDGKYEFLIGFTLWSVFKSKDGKEINVLYRDYPVIKELPVEVQTSGNI